MKSFIFLPQSARYQFLYLIILVYLTCATAPANADSPVPEGMIGWTYYSGLSDTDEHAADPISACARTAMNHMGKPLRAMRENGHIGDRYDCKYRHFLDAGGVNWFATTMLKCKSGYTARWPGVCVKPDEPPPPPRCTQNTPGFTVGNPVQLASGAKLQTETDLTIGQSDGMRITRTYRSLRRNGRAQSGGYGWSFSFDRSFYLGPATATVSGTLADGSYFAFKKSADGLFVSQHDKLMTLTALTTEFSEWVLTSSDGRVERYIKLNGDFKLISASTRSGETNSYYYDATNQLVRIEDEGGRSIKISWNGGVVEFVEGPNGGARYEYDHATVPGQDDIEGMARLIAVHYLDRTGSELSSRHYHYEDERQRFLLTGITDENGARFSTYAYNELAQTVISEHAGGANRYEFAYPSETSRVVTDALGTMRTSGLLFGSDGLGRVTGENQPAGAGCAAGANTLTYTVDGSVASRTDFNGVKTCFINDAARGLETARFSGLPAGSSCPASGSALSVKSARMTSTRWHADWPVISSTAGPNQIVTNVYNGERGSDGKVAQCAGDAVLPSGKQILVVCSKTVQATTDNTGALGFAAVKDGPPRVWQYTYTNTGKLLTRTGPADAGGNVDSIRQTYYADTTDSHATGDLASTTNGAGEATLFLEYSPDGFASKVRTPQGQTNTLHYGPRQQLLESTITANDGRSERTRYFYDAAGQLIRVISPDNSTMDYAYDAAHRLIGQHDGAGNTINFVLDGMGNATHQEVRGVNGELVTQTTRAYDALNRLRSEQRGEQDKGTSYEYDRGGNLTTRRIQSIIGADDAGAGGAGGRMTRMIDESGQTSYTYDGLGRLLSQSQTVITADSSKTFDTSYTYAADGTGAGHVTSITYSSGNRIDTSYGNDGRVVRLAMTAASGMGSVTIMDGISYLPFGPVRAWTWGNSTSTSPNNYERRFDLDGRISSYPLGNPSTGGTIRTLSNDAGGRITASKSTGSPSAPILDQQYDYDSLDRLTGVDGVNINQRFKYDANGNRTQATFGANTYLNTISPGSNRLISAAGPAPTKNNTFDKSGNLISDGTIAYNYGSNGRLRGVLVDGVATSYGYNGLGQRVAKNDSAGVLIHYVYDQAGRILGEYDGQGSAIQETVYLDDLPIAVIEPGTANVGTNQHAGPNVYYVFADHLSTPRVTTRSSDNQMVWRWDNSDPFGMDQPNVNPSNLGEFMYNPRFPGQVYDKETNNHYNMFRDYDPQTGRYVQSDPIGLGGGINTYAYANGAPTKYIDPFGLDAEVCTRPLQLPLPYALHCFIRYNGENNDTQSYDPKGVHPDPQPKGAVCTPTQGNQDDSCLKREMQKCQGADYSFTGHNCCHCAEDAMKACGQSIPLKKWPNYPINPGPQPGETGYKP